MDGMLEGAGRQTEEGYWQAGGCRSQAEVTDGRAGNRPSRVAVINLRDLSVIFCFGQFSYSIQVNGRVTLLLSLASDGK